MQTRKLGNLEVGAIGLGCMSLTGSYGPNDLGESDATLERALELGVTLFDTANAYGLGENERLLGSVLGARRSEIVISTKFGFRVDDGKPRIDGNPDQVADRCNESLERLGTDYIDLYYLHRPDPNVPIEDTVGAMARLVEAGKVRSIGLCEVSAKTLRRAHAVHPITAVQSEYSLWTRDQERTVLPACRELGVGFMPFSPIGRAILTGAVKSRDDLASKQDMRANMPRFQDGNLEQNLAMVTELEALAASISATPGQVALAWLLAKGDDIVPIPGTKRVAYVEQNAAAADVALSENQVAQLDAIFDPERVVAMQRKYIIYCYSCFITLVFHLCRY